MKRACLFCFRVVAFQKEESERCALKHKSEVVQESRRLLDVRRLTSHAAARPRSHVPPKVPRRTCYSTSPGDKASRASTSGMYVAKHGSIRQIRPAMNDYSQQLRSDGKPHCTSANRQRARVQPLQRGAERFTTNASKRMIKMPTSHNIIMNDNFASIYRCDSST